MIDLILSERIFASFVERTKTKSFFYLGQPLSLKQKGAQKVFFCAILHEFYLFFSYLSTKKNILCSFLRSAIKLVKVRNTRKCKKHVFESFLQIKKLVKFNPAKKVRIYLLSAFCPSVTNNIKIMPNIFVQ